jgi:hypothetical protein
MPDFNLRNLNTSTASTWDPAFLARSPAFEALRPAASRIRLDRWPGIDELNRALFDAGVMTGGGHPARLVSAGGSADTAEPYEARAFRAGAICHREREWHDLFNALVWLSFPRAKAALNARHAAELAREAPGLRGRVRDALTLFDEDGLVVIASDPDLLALVRTFRWKELFWRRRADVEANMRFVVFGHGLYAKVRAPFLGMTGRAVLMATAELVFAMPLAERLAAIDSALADLLTAPDLIRTPLDLSPVPVLGVPGWLHTNQDEAFYDNTDYFRPGRTRTRAAS